MRTNDSLDELVKAPNDPFQEILRPFGYLLHISRNGLSENDQAQGHDPANDHGIGDWKPKKAGDLVSFLRKAVLPFFRNRRKWVYLLEVPGSGFSAARRTCGNLRLGSYGGLHIGVKSHKHSCEEQHCKPGLCLLRDFASPS